MIGTTKQRLFIAAFAFTLAACFNLAVYGVHRPSLGWVAFLVVAFWAITMVASLTGRLQRPRALLLGIPLAAFGFAILNYNNAFIVAFGPFLSLVLLIAMAVLLMARPGAHPARGFLDFTFVSKPLEWFSQFTPLLQDLKQGFASEGKGNVGIRKVVLGLLISIPVLLVFFALFAQADAVFSDLSKNLDLGWIPVDRVFHVALMFLLFGAFGYYLASTKNAVVYRAVKEKHIDNTILSTVFLLLNLLFAAFNVVQMKYMFGGAAYVSAQGLNYASFAREGFFALLWVMALAAGMVFFVMKYLHHENRTKFIRLLTTIFVAQLAVIAVAALQRLNLYQNEFGYTTDRLYAEWMVYMIMVVLVAAVVGLVLKWPFHKLLRTTYVIGLTALSLVVLVNIDYVIAKKNVDRALQGVNNRPLDTMYLRRLSIDAVPAYDALLESPQYSGTPQVKNAIKDRAEDTWQHLQDTQSWQQVNVGLHRAERSAVGRMYINNPAGLL